MISFPNCTPDDYRPTWKIIKGYFNHDTAQLYDDDECDYFEEQERLWRKSLYESYGKYSLYSLRKLFGIQSDTQGNSNGASSFQLEPDDIRERIILSEVIKCYTFVTGDYDKKKARCPFHDDHTPSVFIDDKKGLYYCFPCGEGGDIFTFVQKAEDCSFKEALRILSKLL